MDTDLIVMIALGPFYAAAVAATWWGLNFGWHMLRRVDESTTKTALTETVKGTGNSTATPPK